MLDIKASFSPGRKYSDEETQLRNKSEILKAIPTKEMAFINTLFIGRETNHKSILSCLP